MSTKRSKGKLVAKDTGISASALVLSNCANFGTQTARYLSTREALCKNPIIVHSLANMEEDKSHE